MKPLSELLEQISILHLEGSEQAMVREIRFNSREVEKGDLFVAVRGVHADGHLFIGQAADSGAQVIVCETMPDERKAGTTYVQVEQSDVALGLLASAFYGYPSVKLKLVGITGTNGKTTVATLLYKLFQELGFKAGLISTVQNFVDTQIYPATHTTPDPVALNALLAEMLHRGCDYCFMEVSSHAVVQHRISGLNFAGGVFTNLSHDHLDFHKTFAAYIKAKKAFFDELPKNAFALVNADDRNGTVMLQNTKAYPKTYALKSMADYRGRVVESHFDGMLLQLEGRELWVKLVGEFNAYNLLAVYGTALLLEQDTMKVLTILSRISGAEGRFDVSISPEGVIGVVDYAHTPDAVENVLKTIGSVRGGKEQVITVIGCGGDRDRTKRPEMAEVACRLSDKVILTSDNPRSEDPAVIIQEMEQGVPASERRKVFSITDRREAIRAAFHLATAGDVILVAGKGHEKYQEIKGTKLPFDDKELLRGLFFPPDQTKLK